MVNPLIEVAKVNLSYGEQKVVDSVSFSLSSGRVMALIGPNGAGKSSIMRILAGLVKPENGQIICDGSALKSFHALNYIAGFFIEAPSFYGYLTAVQNLSLIKEIKGGNESIDELLELVGLMDAKNKKVSQYSKGMKQRLGIAQALFGDPKLLVLDEPFHGLDPEVKLFLMKIIENLAKDKNKAILVSSHQLQDMEDLADDFILLNKGKVHLSGKLSDFLSQKQKVTFWFKAELSADLLKYLPKGHTLPNNSKTWISSLSMDETTETVKKCAEHGYYPYKVERENLLHAKYMEIAE